HAPLAAPELKPLPTLAPLLLGGAVPRWYESVEEVRKQAGLPAGTAARLAAAWQIGRVYALSATPTLREVPVQIDYYFLGDNLVGYGLRFFVQSETDRKLWDDLIAQGRQQYGPPRHEANGSVDWLLPQLAVHAALTDSAAMSSMSKRPTQLANVHWTV